MNQIFKMNEMSIINRPSSKETVFVLNRFDFARCIVRLSRVGSSVRNKLSRMFAGRYYPTSIYSKIRVKGAHLDHDNLLIITGVPW